MKEVLKGIWPHAPLVNCRKDKRSEGAVQQPDPMTHDPAPTGGCFCPIPSWSPSVRPSLSSLVFYSATLAHFLTSSEAPKATTSRR